MKLSAIFLTLLIGFFSSNAIAAKLCPNGQYVDRGPCKLCPDGSYIGGGGSCKLTPSGSYVREQNNSGYNANRPKLTPQGTYVEGGRGTRLCPDGTYVAGSRCKLTPSGKYIGVN